ncbi:hypothetical protein G7Y89_g12217 [Cudoniella acicularis]|uniref:Uncharacterized protein n=1 Tax=Cudoniella acicularis TaxID=354080 RepID=A0A8H4RBY6_9HELO|nr:hypothetical protein G7Y89_g12217 [Cudoniella acicularis]
MPAFIGCILGFIWGGPLSDWSILYFTKRNNGIYEPEMRLYLAIFPALIGPVGLFLYGYGTAAGMPWIVPCIGIGIFGFDVTALGDISLTYLSDSYREILGDALVGIAFVRNLLAAGVIFAQDPWTDAVGLHGLFTCVGCISIGLNILIIPLTFWGKKFRIKCAKRQPAIHPPRSSTFLLELRMLVTLIGGVMLVYPLDDEFPKQPPIRLESPIFKATYNSKSNFHDNRGLQNNPLARLSLVNLQSHRRVLQHFLFSSIRLLENTVGRRTRAYEYRIALQLDFAIGTPLSLLPPNANSKPWEIALHTSMRRKP